MASSWAKAAAWTGSVPGRAGSSFRNASVRFSSVVDTGWSPGLGVDVTSLFASPSDSVGLRECERSRVPPEMVQASLERRKRPKLLWPVGLGSGLTSVLGADLWTTRQHTADPGRLARGSAVSGLRLDTP